MTTTVDIQTRDGICPAALHRPSGEGPWPAVLVYMDGLGIRPAMLEISERLATYGYLTLLPDLFYRAGPYAPIDAKAVVSDPERIKILRAKYSIHYTTANIMSDTSAFLDYLAALPETKRGPVGAVGYCVGGRMALTAAGSYPERIAAVAAYHPGGPATDAPDSPHLLAPKIKARVYVAQASDDPWFPDDMKARLAGALTSAGVDHQIETYPAKHGWVLPDMPVYDAAAAARHWQTLASLFDATLKA
jgi:carboxymethylenebutenolidase